MIDSFFAGAVQPFGGDALSRMVPSAPLCDPRDLIYSAPFSQNKETISRNPPDAALIVECPHLGSER